MANQFKAKLNPFTGTLQLVPTNVVLAFKAGVASQANLPLTGNAIGDARIANDTGHLYVWSIEASSGILTDWSDAGDMVDVEWAAINGKPSSSVANIDDAVTKRHTQNSDLYLATQGTSTLYVDKNRVDTYTADGSITKPYKTISEALTAATGLDRLIKISSGVYTESLTIPGGTIILEGLTNTDYGTKIVGNITSGNNTIEFRDLKVTGNWTATLGNITLKSVYINGTFTTTANNIFINSQIDNLIVNGSRTLRAVLCDFVATNSVSLIYNSTGISSFSNCSIHNSGDFNVIQQTNGYMFFEGGLVYNTGATAATILSSLGLITLSGTHVLNYGVGKSLDINNGATSTLPNIISGIVTFGDIACGTAITLISGLSTTGTVTGAGAKYDITAGDGISVTLKTIANTDKGSTAVGTHELAYNHSDIHVAHSDDQDASQVNTDVTGQSVQDKLDDLDSNKTTLSAVKSDVDIADAISTKHSHSNKSTLDGTQESFTTTLKNKLDNIVNPMLFKGEINVAADFPTLILVQNGWVYRIKANVTDNDASKTNTGQSFLTDAEIAWNGTNWTDLGYGSVKSINGKTGIVTLVASEINTDSTGVTVQDHIDDVSNPHSVTKTQVGLGDVVNGAQVPSIIVAVFEYTTPVTTGDGKAYIAIPSTLNGMNLTRAQAIVITAGTTNPTTIAIYNKTDSQEMLSSNISIASGDTVGTPGTIDTTHDDVSTNDILRVDVDAVSTTAPLGLLVILEFSK